MGPLGKAAIQTGANMIGSIVGGIGANKRAKKQHQYNKQLTDYQHKKNLEARNIQKAYNTPQAQMQRYKDAGINPHMVASSGSSGNAQSIAPYQSIQTEQTSGLEGLQGTMENAGASINNYLDLERKKTENKILDTKLMEDNLNLLEHQEYNKGSHSYMDHQGVVQVRKNATRYAANVLNTLSSTSLSYSKKNKQELENNITKKTTDHIINISRIKNEMMKYGNIPEPGNTSFMIAEYIKKNGTKNIENAFRGLPKGLLQSIIKIFRKGK